MVKMPPEIKDIVAKQKPLPIATADKSGKPNVVFVTMWKILDDETLVLSDNYFNKTAKNLVVNPWVAIVCWDQEKRRSYQLKCQVISIEQGHFKGIIRSTVDVIQGCN